ncbi:hypothetical protein R6Q59_030363 [Mikania micrantha]
MFMGALPISEPHHRSRFPRRLRWTRGDLLLVQKTCGVRVYMGGGACNGSGQMDILIWIYECFPYIRKVCAYNETIPRGIGWHKTQKHKLSTVAKILKQSTEVEFLPRNLLPTSEELNEKWLKESFNYINPMFLARIGMHPSQQNIPFDDMYRPVGNAFFDNKFVNINNEVNNNPLGRTNPESSNTNLNSVMEKLNLVIKSQDTQHRYYQGYLEDKLNPFISRMDKYASGDRSKEQVEGENDDDLTKFCDNSTFATPLSQMMDTCKDKGRGRRIKKKSKLLAIPVQGFGTTLQDKREETHGFTEQLLNELSNRNDFWIYTTFDPNVALGWEFWEAANSAHGLLD